MPGSCGNGGLADGEVKELGIALKAKAGIEAATLCPSRPLENT